MPIMVLIYYNLRKSFFVHYGLNEIVLHNAIKGDQLVGIVKFNSVKI